MMRPLQTQAQRVCASGDEFDSLSKTTGVLKALGVTGLASVTVKEKFGVTVGDSFAYSWKEALKACPIRNSVKY